MMRQGGFLIRGGVVAFLLTLGLLVCPKVLFAASAEENYKWYCSQCHGLEGRGNGINAGQLAVKARDHTDRSDPNKYMRNLSDKIIFKSIKFGGEANKKSSLMPPWDGVLSDDEIRDLVKYLRKLCCE